MVSNLITAPRQLILNQSIREWVASGPGVFQNANMNTPIAEAHKAFTEFSGLHEHQDVFEQSLKAECGFWLGAVGFKGEYLWILALPRKAARP